MLRPVLPDMWDLHPVGIPFSPEQPGWGSLLTRGVR